MAGVHDVKASLCRQPVEHADHSERSDEANSTQINRGRTLRSSRSEDLPSTSARETGVRASVGMSRCAKLAGAAGGTGAPPAPAAAAAASSFPSPRAALLASPQNITQAQEPKQANGARAHGESSRGRLLEVAAADDDDLHGAHPLPAHREAPSRSSRSIGQRTLAGPGDVRPPQPEWHTGRRRPRQSIPLSWWARAWR